MAPELTARQRLVDTLSGDLLAGPWDQPSKLWFLKGEAGDEWLEYAGEFNSSPENRLLDIVLDDSLPADATGILVATEGWDYPRQLSASLKAKGDDALKAYWALYPPSEHPKRVSTRNLVLACNDGDVIGLTKREDVVEEASWAKLDASTPCPTGNRLIDTARALLGQYPDLLDKLNQTDGLRAIKSITDTIDQAISGRLDQVETTIALLEAIPEPQRSRMIQDMPDEVKSAIRSMLSEDQVRRFGLEEN